MTAMILITIGVMDLLKEGPNTSCEIQQFFTPFAYPFDFEVQIPRQHDMLEKTQVAARKILLTTKERSPHELGEKQACAVIRVIPKEETESYPDYHKLRCTNTDKEIIAYIVSSMGKQSYFWLMNNAKDLREKGKEINDVHPLKFLETVFSPEGREKGLPDHMKALMGSYFTRTNFLDGLAPSLTRKSIEGHLHIYEEDFAKAIGVSLQEIHPYFQEQDWEEMVQYLMKVMVGNK